MLGIQLSALRRSLSNYQRYYRWDIEPSFRDTKDLRFGLCAVRIADPQRRDRLLLLNAFAVVLLTLLGAAGESLGMISSPTPSRPAPIPCFARAPRSTT